MKTENLSTHFKFNSEIDENGQLTLPVNQMKDFYQNGIRNVSVEITLSTKENPISTDFDKVLFDKIKELQSLPESVVFDFLNAKGKLFGSDFKSRISF